MEGFSKQPLPPPLPPSSVRCNNADKETGKAMDSVSAELPKSQELSRAEAPVDRDHEKKLKRVLATREYSKRYHDKQLQRIDNLETQVKLKETEIAVKSPRVRFTRRTNMLLRAENDSMQQKLETVAGKLTVKEAEYRELLKERDILKQSLKMQQAAVAFNPLVQPPSYMAFNPPAQFDCQIFGTDFGPSYQPYNPPAGLDSVTVGFGQFHAPVAADQFNFKPPGLDEQLRSDHAAINRQLDEPVGFSEFTNELSLVVGSHIMPSKGADKVTDEDGMNLDASDDSKKAAGSSSYQFL